VVYVFSYLEVTYLTVSFYFRMFLFFVVVNGVVVVRSIEITRHFSVTH